MEEEFDNFTKVQLVSCHEVDRSRKTKFKLKHYQQLDNGYLFVVHDEETMCTLFAVDEDESNIHENGVLSPDRSILLLSQVNSKEFVLKEMTFREYLDLDDFEGLQNDLEYEDFTDLREQSNKIAVILKRNDKKLQKFERLLLRIDLKNCDKVDSF
jgi:hypothetical protein